jgi:rhodanese-related sulfurtransferase
MRIERAEAASPPVDRMGLVAWLLRHFGDIPSLDSETLAGWLDDRDRVPPVLVDVRTPGEQAVSTLPGALRVAPDSDPAPVLRQARAGQPIVVYCAVGVRSARFARALRAAGHRDVANLVGGIFDWANRGLPLAGPDGPATRVHPYDRPWAVLLAPERRA